MLGWRLWSGLSVADSARSPLRSRSVTSLSALAPLFSATLNPRSASLHPNFSRLRCVTRSAHMLWLSEQRT